MSDDMFTRLDAEETAGWDRALTYVGTIDEAGDNGAGADAIIAGADPEDEERRKYEQAAKSAARIVKGLNALTQRQAELFIIMAFYGCTNECRIAEAWGVSQPNVAQVKTAMQKNFQKSFVTE